jgi:hypothetical protein
MHVTLNGLVAGKNGQRSDLFTFIHNKEGVLLLAKVFALAGAGKTQYHYQ